MQEVADSSSAAPTAKNRWKIGFFHLVMVASAAFPGKPKRYLPVWLASLEGEGIGVDAGATRQAS
jgi:hypothetical protein